MAAVKTVPKLDPAKRIFDWLVAPYADIPIKQPGHFPGPDPPAWQNFATIVQQMIEEHNLQPIDEIALELKNRPEHRELAELVLKWKDIKGGINPAHLHYQNKIYPVTPTEWNEFSKAALVKLQQKFTENLGSISYENQCTAINSMMKE